MDHLLRMRLRPQRRYPTPFAHLLCLCKPARRYTSRAPATFAPGELNGRPTTSSAGSGAAEAGGANGALLRRNFASLQFPHLCLPGDDISRRVHGGTELPYPRRRARCTALAARKHTPTGTPASRTRALAPRLATAHLPATPSPATPPPGPGGPAPAHAQHSVGAGPPTTCLPVVATTWAGQRGAA